MVTAIVGRWSLHMTRPNTQFAYIKLSCVILAGCVIQDVLQMQEGLGQDLELLYVGCLQVDIPIEDQEVKDSIGFGISISVGQHHGS